MRILVTGVSAGIGVETAPALAARGAQVLGAAMDLEKAGAAAKIPLTSSRAAGSPMDDIRLLGHRTCFQPSLKHIRP
jgi:NAD(P)-dependent dehydrogenase (short-subunit alcohol dehydrogenase family)